MNEPIKPLTEYTKNGYHFKLHRKLSDWAIFIGTKDGVKSPNYEACHLRITPAGSRILLNPRPGTSAHLEWPAHERAPGDNEWGLHGFTCVSLEEAEAKLIRGVAFQVERFRALELERLEKEMLRKDWNQNQLP